MALSKLDLEIRNKTPSNLRTAVLDRHLPEIVRELAALSAKRRVHASAVAQTLWQRFPETTSAIEISAIGKWLSARGYTRTKSTGMYTYTIPEVEERKQTPATNVAESEIPRGEFGHICAVLQDEALPPQTRVALAQAMLTVMLNKP